LRLKGKMDASIITVGDADDLERVRKGNVANKLFG
jgi:hypothetical protein